MISRRRLALATALVAALGSSALAVQPSSRPQAMIADTVALPSAGAPFPLRDHVEYVHQQGPASAGPAWARLQAAAPGLSQASWDRATGVPARIWGRGIEVPGSVRDPDIAAQAAWRFLTQHAELLAPGASVADFELVANVERNGLRVVGFLQRHAGMPVFGGQVSFRFKHDRLFVIGSEALPGVRVTLPTHVLAAAVTGPRAAAATALELGLAADQVTTGAPGALAIVPLVGAHGVMGYRVAVPVEVDAGAQGRWQVFSDPASGAPILRRALTRYGRGTVAFDAVERWRGRPRAVYPASSLDVSVSGGGVTTATDGAITWSGTAPVSVMTTVTGPLVDVTNRAGEPATTTLSVADNGMGIWSPADDVTLDAQLSGYVHAHVVKQYARTFAPDLPFLDEQQPVRVNIADECNAYSDGTSINFYAASDRCENTATIADVVYHEYGHSIHFHALVAGVGFFDGAFSEGLSDYLAATITNDSAMGRGFFKSDEPLREINPVGRENVWPRDVAELHYTGIIFAGAMWDLRAAAIDAMGYEAGRAYADRMFYAAVQRAPSIPATLVEILAEDDDDGDLTNGTPHECLIRGAFSRHGLRTIGGVLDAADVVPASDTATTMPVTLTLSGVNAACGDDITSVRVQWRPKGGSDSPRSGSTDATATDEVWTAEVPLPDDGDTGQFKLLVTFADDTQMAFPDNASDPWYQVYRGDLMPLYCTNFEQDPFADGWRADADGSWQWGVPGGSIGFHDPAQAYSGTRVLGMGLSASDGGYHPNRVSWVESPTIPTGQWSDVRLQYRRWLTVADGFFDQARVVVNGEQAWANLSSHGDSNHYSHHEDRAWVFNDLSLSSRIFDKEVTLRWEIDADDEFELGGWNLDDVCVVANIHSVCGDGTKTVNEQCDEGAANADVPDTCRTNCRLARCGDGIVDQNEACDDGNKDESDDCTMTCDPIDHPDVSTTQPGGCCSASAGPGDAALPSALVVLGLGLLGLAARRRSGGPRRARAR